MDFLQERDAFERELDDFYATYPTDISAANRHMDETSGQHPEWSPYRRKGMIYETAAEQCAVHLFRCCPFYYELEAGRGRTRWGFEGVGAWMKNTDFGVRYNEDGHAWKQPWDAFVRFNGRTDTDLDHHCAGYDNVLQLGLNGLIARAQMQLERTTDERQRSFLESAVIGLCALSTIADRFADRAEEMLKGETDELVRSRFERIATAARRTPAEPPQTFFEALNTLVFIREILGSIEGIGISTFGHMDRMLGPYYEADLEAGRIDRDEAKNLLGAFLAFTDVKFESRRNYNETSTTVFIGGCEADGTPVFNDVTCMIVELFEELGLINSKFQARISPAHPEAYFDLISDYIAAGTNVMAVYNDPIVIEANVRTGKRIEDARFYVGGGCQENILQNTEISSRATMFFSLPAVLDMGLFPERWSGFTDAEDLELTPQGNCETFDEFYRAFIDNLRTVVDRLVANRNRYEADGWRYNPCPLLSSTISDCIENGRDMTEGGCRYSTGSVDMAGIGTLVDSLYAHRSSVSLGEALGATPDGRRAGAYLSQSMGPSLEALGNSSEIGAVLSALEPLDLSDYPVVAVLDLKLPALSHQRGGAVIKPVIKRFLDSGGSVLQLNVVDTKTLREAREHPERHPDLAVRVSGFSVYFNTLTPQVQDELIARTEVQVGS